jgi:GxxExxY protein
MNRHQSTRIGPDRFRIERIGSIVVDSAIRVHRALGPGLLESAYQACLSMELRSSGLWVDTEVEIPIEYRGLRVKVGYRIDMLVDHSVVIENKVVEHLLPIHTAQLLTYLELSGRQLGYLLHWNVTLMKSGIHRFVVGPWDTNAGKWKRDNDQNGSPPAPD